VWDFTAAWDSVRAHAEQALSTLQEVIPPAGEVVLAQRPLERGHLTADAEHP
jgi:hypothetical protein